MEISSLLLILSLFLPACIVVSWIWAFQTKKSLRGLLRGLEILSDGLMEVRNNNFTRQIPYDSPKSFFGFREIQTLSKAVRRSIGVYNTLTLKPLDRIAYFGADSYFEGRIVGKKMAELLQEEGAVAVVQLKNDLTGTMLRQKGFEDVCRESYPKIRIVGVQETFGHPEKTAACVQKWIQAHKDLRGVYIVEGLTVSAAADVIRGSSRKIHLIGHDLSEKTAFHLKEGNLQATLSQNLFSQGYNPVIALYNHKTSNWTPENPRQLVDIDVITSTNLLEFWESGKGLVVSEYVRAKLLQPVRAASTPLRIVVVGDERYPIYLQIRQGVFEAREVLESYNVVVDWLVPEQYLVPDGPILTTDQIVSFIEKIRTEKKFDALALMVNSVELVPYLNGLVQDRVAVASFNSEPLGLRGLVHIVQSNVQEIQEVSGVLSDSSKETNAAIHDIANAITEIAQGANRQSDSAKLGLETVEALETAVGNVLTGMQEQSYAVQDSLSVAGSLEASIGKGAQQIARLNSIKSRFEESARKIQNMKGQAASMSSILETIQDISDQTNILSLNAFIQAARAGIHGKGFSVVADEIRDLAHQTQLATSKVSEVIAAFSASLNDTASGILENEKSVDAEISHLRQTTEEMSSLTRSAAQGMETVSQIVRKTEATAGVMSSNLRAVLQKIQEIVSVSMENSAASTEISSTTVELSRHTRALVQLASNLSHMALVLQGTILQFDLHSDAV